MFPIRLTHPLHGATHAHDTQEMERLKKLGWQDASVVHISQPEVLAVAPRQKRPYNRKAA